MRDIFYTILIIWVVWRIYVAFLRSRAASRQNQHSNTKKEGETTVDYIPENKKKREFKGGEYVDYEEVN